LGNDVAFAFALAQFSRLREDWQRTVKNRLWPPLMMDCIVPGGVLWTSVSRAATRCCANVM
jgi:hypothetical protein